MSELVKLLAEKGIMSIYIRKSRDEEDIEDVLIKHRNQLIEFAKKNNVKYKIYEEVVSGDSIAERPQMQLLLDDIEKGIYIAVIVIDIDRLARGDTQDQGLIKNILKESNTLVITVEPFYIYDLTKDIDDTFFGLKTFMSREEYKTIKSRLINGKKNGAKLGKWVNGFPPLPYVYNYKTKSLDVDEEQLKTYELLKDLYLNQNIGLKNIAFELNKMGIPSPKGKTWGISTVTRLLTNEVHLGKVIYGKNKEKRRGKKIPQPRDKWIIVENCHPPVKAEEEHQLIMAKLHKQRTIADRAKSGTFIFSGLLECGVCGKNLQFSRRVWHTQRNSIRCTYQDNIGTTCSNIGCSEDILIEATKDFLNNQFLQTIVIEPDCITNKKDKSLTKSILDQKVKELSKHEKALDKVKKLFEEEEYTFEEYNERKQLRVNEINQLKKEITEIENIVISNELTKISKEQIVNAVENIINNWEVLQTNQLNTLLKTIFRKIIYLRTDRKELPQIEFILNL